MGPDQSETTWFKSPLYELSNDVRETNERSVQETYERFAQEANERFTLKTPE